MIVKKINAKSNFDFRNLFGIELEKILPFESLEENLFDINQLDSDLYMYIRNDFYIGSIKEIAEILEKLEKEVLLVYENEIVALISDKELNVKDFNDFNCEKICLDKNDENILVNSSKTLQKLINFVKIRTNTRHLENGVLILDINSTYISEKAEIESGVIIKPYSNIYGNSVISKGAIIGQNVNIQNSKIGERAKIINGSNITDSVIESEVVVENSTIVESFVGSNTKIGPYAYLRPNSKIGKNVKIGDFVEVKNSTMKDGSKASHLSYIGDSDVGERVNIGCGVVFVNYDGKNKHRTVVGDDTFIGCNVNLVSPVNVGSSAFIAAGSTVTNDVKDKQFAIARERQVNKDGWSLKKKD